MGTLGCTIMANELLASLAEVFQRLLVFQTKPVLLGVSTWRACEIASYELVGILSTKAILSAVVDGNLCGFYRNGLDRSVLVLRVHLVNLTVSALVAPIALMALLLAAMLLLITTSMITMRLTTSMATVDHHRWHLRRRWRWWRRLLLWAL